MAARVRRRRLPNLVFVPDRRPAATGRERARLLGIPPAAAAASLGRFAIRVRESTYAPREESRHTRSESTSLETRGTSLATATGLVISTAWNEGHSTPDEID
jgi:hypothetical protein